MKNIHLLPTNQPSRLWIWMDELRLGNLTHQSKLLNISNQNLYITNNEKFVRDEYITDGIEVIKATPKLVNAQGLVNRRNWKKIILTTDFRLAPDVQSIDDEFLEWFVQNPTCEEVEIDYGFFTPSGKKVDPMGILQNHSKCVWIYKIIIPKEEPKQDLEKEMFELEEQLDIPSHLRWHNSKPKQETLEQKQETLEQMINILPKKYAENLDLFLKGMQYQKDQDKNKYSEEDLIEFSEWISHNDWVYLPKKSYWVNEEQEELEQKFTTKELFEKFKNK